MEIGDEPIGDETTADEQSTAGDVRVGILGLGYVGLPLAIVFALRNIEVIGFDINKDRIGKLYSDSYYISGISDSDVRNVHERNLFHPTSDI